MSSFTLEDCADDLQSLMITGSAIDSPRSASGHSAAQSFFIARHFHQSHHLKNLTKLYYSASTILSLAYAKLVSRHFVAGVQSSLIAFTIEATSFLGAFPQLS